MMQVAEMADAQAGHLEDEDRIAVGHDAAEPADVGGHIADGDVADAQMVLGRPAFRVPAAQHVGDARIGGVGVVRRMGPVHGDHVGHHAAGYAGVIGGDGDALMALDEKRRVADEATRTSSASSCAGVKAACWRRGTWSATARQRLIWASAGMAAMNRHARMARARAIMIPPVG
jgi:hypothetical protein